MIIKIGDHWFSERTAIPDHAPLTGPHSSLSLSFAFVSIVLPEIILYFSPLSESLARAKHQLCMVGGFGLPAAVSPAPARLSCISDATSDWVGGGEHMCPLEWAAYRVWGHAGH